MSDKLVELLAAARGSRRTEPLGGRYGYLDTPEGGKNRYALFPNPNEGTGERLKGTIIFMPGRTEFIEKFFEDIHMFHALGFACAGFDLGGQGLSYREHENRDKHYLKSFDPHMGDVKQLFDNVLETADREEFPKPFILMGHSAGSHTILRFLSENPGYAGKAVTVAPMVRIEGGGLPDFIAYGLPKLMIAFGKGDAYVPLKNEIEDENLKDWRQRLKSHIPTEAKDYFIEHKDRDLAVGGATYQWLLAALRSTDKLNAPGVAEAINVPVLMLQASEDKIVDNTAQTAFAARNDLINLKVIEGAMHEILKERDEMREQVWRAIIDFMAIPLE